MYVQILHPLTRSSQRRSLCSTLTAGIEDSIKTIFIVSLQIGTHRPFPLGGPFDPMHFWGA